MNYRVLSRFFAISNLTVRAIVALILIVIWCRNILEYLWYYDPQEAMRQIDFWLCFCALHIIATKRLMKATKEGANPNSAMSLTSLWWKLAWFSTVFGAIRFFITFYQSHSKFRNYDVYFTWIFYLESAGLAFNCLALFCVHKFRKEIQSGIIHALTVPTTPMTPIVNLNCECENQRPENNYPHVHGPSVTFQNPQLPPPSYESVKCSEI